MAKDDDDRMMAKDDDDFLAKRKARNAARTASLRETNPKATSPGATLDSQISTLQTQTGTLSTDVSSLEQRVAALEAGTPPDPIPPEPIPPDPGTKRWPDYNDPMCGVPAGTTLTTTGGTTITTAGAKISGKKFTGRVTVKADNVEIFNCEIATSDWWGIDVKAANCNIHHCYIHSETVMQNSGVNTSNGTRLAYCRFRGWENSVNLTGSDVVYEWNDSCKLKGDPNVSHYDNLQADGGSTNVQIRNNRHVCEFGWTSCCMIDNYFGNMDKIEIHDNYMEGGGYVCYIDGSQNSANRCTNVVYHHNTLKAGQWGYFYWKNAGSGCSHHDNVDENGRAID